MCCGTLSLLYRLACRSACSSYKLYPILIVHGLYPEVASKHCPKDSDEHDCLSGPIHGARAAAPLSRVWRRVLRALLAVRGARAKAASVTSRARVPALPRQHHAPGIERGLQSRECCAVFCGRFSRYESGENPKYYMQLIFSYFLPETKILPPLRCNIAKVICYET